MKSYQGDEDTSKLIEELILSPATKPPYSLEQEVLR